MKFNSKVILANNFVFEGFVEEEKGLSKMTILNNKNSFPKKFFPIKELVFENSDGTIKSMAPRFCIYEEGLHGITGFSFLPEIFKDLH